MAQTEMTPLERKLTRQLLFARRDTEMMMTGECVPDEDSYQATIDGIDDALADVPDKAFIQTIEAEIAALVPRDDD